MKLEDLDQIFGRSTQSAFRLETLPQYLVPQEADDFARWRAGRRLPLETPETSSWLAEIQATTARGYRWYRVHILDYPLTAYSEFELYGYQANQAAGEEVFIADRSWSRELETLREDFWLLDDATVIRMIYDDEGHFIRPELGDNIDYYLGMRSVALQHCEPLGDYLARREPQLIA